MNKLFLIFLTIICISSLVYGRGIIDMLKDAVKTGDIKPLAKALENDRIEDKTYVLIKADEMGLSDNNIFFLASIIGVPDIVRNLLNKDVNVNAVDESNHTALFEAISNLRPEVVKVLLSHPGIKVDKNYLDLAKEIFLKIEEVFKNIRYDAEDATTLEMDKNNIRQIGRMLINYLGLYTGESRISKEGIKGIYNLPDEMISYIATFGN